LAVKLPELLGVKPLTGIGLGFGDLVQGDILDKSRFAILSDFLGYICSEYASEIVFFPEPAN